MDINCDLGEYDDLSAADKEAQIMPFISACNIACGGHAGNDITMRHTVLLAKEYGVAIGAHPSYPDSTNFGRQSMDLSHQQLYEELSDQIQSIKKIAEQQDMVLHHVKPHGALYNDAADDLGIAKVIVKVMAEIDSNLKLYGQAHSAMAEAANMFDICFVAEAFIDRRYLSRHRLVPRAHRDALIGSLTEQLQQAEYLITRQGLYGHDGQWLSIDSQNLCLHGDQPNALATAQAMDALLKKLGINKSKPK